MIGIAGPIAESYAARWDPPDLKEGASVPESVDFGWIGEDSSGVYMRSHPEYELSQRAHLWDPVHSMWTGDHKIRRDDARRLSNFHFEAKAVMALALTRERGRRTQESIERGRSQK